MVVEAYIDMLYCHYYNCMVYFNDLLIAKKTIFYMVFL
jgi:hypothetical protein